jgi:4-aminobutyrate aminotransferase-like enzyme
MPAPRRAARGPDAAAAKRIVEAVKERGALRSRIGPTGSAGSVLKIRPPLALRDEDVPMLTETLRGAVADVLD